MAAEKKKRTPVVKRVKHVLKIKRDVLDIYIRAKEMNYYKHAYAPLTDSIEYFVYTPYGELHGSVPLIFLTIELGIDTDTLREYIEDEWGAVSDVVASRIITLSELDKTVPPETKDTKVIEITEEYIRELMVCLKRLRGRK